MSERESLLPDAARAVADDLASRTTRPGKSRLQGDGQLAGPNYDRWVTLSADERDSMVERLRGALT